MVMLNNFQPTCEYGYKVDNSHALTSSQMVLKAVFEWPDHFFCNVLSTYVVVCLFLQQTGLKHKLFTGRKH